VLGVGVFPGHIEPHPLFAMLAFIAGGIAAIASSRARTATAVRLRRRGHNRDGGVGGRPVLLELDDEEAVAVAVGLRTAASGSIAGIEETSVRALAKLQQVPPPRLRRRISAFQSSTLSMPSPGPQVDPDVLTVIASACRDHESLRFDYRAHSGAASRRSVEPYRLVNDRRRWYLAAWDTDRDAWRTFRVDRIEPRTPTGPRFTPRALPPDREIAAQVARGVGEAAWRYRARVIVRASAAYVRGRLPIPMEVHATVIACSASAYLAAQTAASSCHRLPCSPVIASQGCKSRHLRGGVRPGTTGRMTGSVPGNTITAGSGVAGRCERPGQHQRPTAARDRHRPAGCGLLVDDGQHTVTAGAGRSADGGTTALGGPAGPAYGSRQPTPRAPASIRS
jgi:hypothetical protein